MEKKRVTTKKKKDPKKVGRLSSSSGSEGAKEFSDISRSKNSSGLEVSVKRKKKKKARRN